MELPFILSGPLLRRVDQNSIYIWIALSEPVDIRANLYKIHRDSIESSFQYELTSDYSIIERIRLGSRLYVYLMKILPLQGVFPTQTLLGYNLHFQRKGKTVDLGSFDLLSPQNPHSIVYGEFKYPTFFINNSEETNIFYGSCRKFHNNGYDSLASADAILEDEHTNLEKRPNSLFLMGDQIYADDVPDPIFPSLVTIGRELIGKGEDLVNLDSRLENEPFFSSINKINGRQFIMENFCKFTSKTAQNHMITFGEYAALYLMSWAPQLWDAAEEMKLINPFEEELEKDHIYFVYPNHLNYKKERKKELEQLRQRYTEQHHQIQVFRESLPKIRRILANVPTYMMFDDHDITDDWNLSATWKQNVAHSPLGKHVVTNGLAAYWAFQGWGNDPNDFNKQFIPTVEDYFDSFNVSSFTYHKFVELLTNFDSWQFVTPTKPKALFLDTRTKRSYPPTPKPARIGNKIEENISPPALINEHGWNQASKALRNSGWVSGEPLMIISATPLYGVGLIESFLLNYIYPFRILNIPVHSALDFEAWKYNGRGFHEFQLQIEKWNPSSCILLSGDVHYASAVKSDISFANGRERTLLQFTSSPLNNMSFYGLGGKLMKSIIWLNSYKRKREELHRFCDIDLNLINETKETPCPDTYSWKETIRYLSTENKEIIETNNNLGLLRLSPRFAQNTLLKYFGLSPIKTPYKTVFLD